MIHHKVLRKQEQSKLIKSRLQQIIQIMTEINKIEMTKSIYEMNETESLKRLNAWHTSNKTNQKKAGRDKMKRNLQHTPVNPKDHEGVFWKITFLQSWKT